MRKSSKSNTWRMNLSVPTSFKNRVKRAAKRDGLTVTEYVRRALVAEIELAKRETDCEHIERTLGYERDSTCSQVRR